MELASHMKAGPGGVDSQLNQQRGRRAGKWEHRTILGSAARGNRTRRVELACSSRTTAFGTRSRGDVRRSQEERSTGEQRTQAEAKTCRRTVEVRRSVVMLPAVERENQFILPFHRSPLVRSFSVWFFSFPSLSSRLSASLHSHSRLPFVFVWC